jgi:hypothetical protein
MSSCAISAGLPILASNSLCFHQWKAKVKARLGAHALLHVFNYPPLPSDLPKECVQDNGKVIDLFFDTISYDLVTLFSSDTHTNPTTHACDAWTLHFNHNDVVTHHDLEMSFWTTTMKPSQDVVSIYMDLSSRFAECVSAGLAISQVKACMHFLDIIIEKHPFIFGPVLLLVTQNNSTLSHHSTIRSKLSRDSALSSQPHPQH